jgi:CBS domain-containing protein
MKGHARQLMKTTVQVASPATTIAEAAQLLAHCDITSLPVIDNDGVVVGIITESDLLTLLLRSSAVGSPIETIMHSPVYTVDEFTPTDTVIRLLQEKGVHHLPVTRQGVVVGLITPQEVLRYFVDHHLPPPPRVA